MTDTPAQDCRVLVVQNGARHNYAVPDALARAGMLAGFYTDACGNEGLGKWISWFSWIPGVGSKARLLKNRTVPESVLPFARSFPLSVAADRLLDPRPSFRPQARLTGLMMELAGGCDADMIYSFLGWSPHFLARAHARGTTVVTEFYVRPSWWRVHQEECLKFPAWEASRPSAELMQSTEKGIEVCDYSDHVVCPAQAVKDDIVREGLFREDRIHVVPYGIAPSFFETENRPVPGKVLFVGSCVIAKGIHYFAMASQKVLARERADKPQFFAAGEASTQVREQPECAQVIFLGRVPRHEINRLYADADVLVFPSLSDSFGMVMLEAMAAGIPVVCSPYCADVVEDGVSGFVVEPRDTDALADAIAKILDDRPLREEMARAAKERARQFTLERHGRRLVDTLRSIHGTRVNHFEIGSEKHAA